MAGRPVHTFEVLRTEQVTPHIVRLVLVLADPAHLDPGSLAQFASRDPVLAVGDGKILLDGRLQPISALGTSSDFLGWSKPPTKASAQPAAAAPPPLGPAS